MTTTRLEKVTLEFWEISLACHGDPHYVVGQTFQTIIERLNPLRIQGEFHNLRRQSEELAELMVLDKTHKKEGTVCLLRQQA